MGMPLQELSLVPFAALRKEESSPYLIQSYALSMVPSLHTLGMAARRNKALLHVQTVHARNNMLLVGNPTNLDDPSMGSLADAKDEVSRMG
jgi:hypothetical protein